MSNRLGIIGVEIQMVKVISIYAVFKIKNVNEINLEYIFLKGILGSYMPLFCIFNFDMASSYPDASNKFTIHISIKVQ